MRFRQYDPYKSFFADADRAFRDSNGQELAEEHTLPDLLEIGCEMAGYFGPLTSEKWQDWLSGVDAFINEMRANLQEASAFKNVSFVMPNGDPIDPEWIHASPASIVLAFTSLLRATGYPKTDLAETLGGVLGMVCFSQIDYALLGLHFDDRDALQMTFDGGFTAAKLLRVMNELIPREAIEANLRIITRPTETKHPTIVLSAIREGARLGGLRSAETRRQRALDTGAVVAAARSLGWPGTSSGIKKRLASRFNCTPERIGQILRAAK